MFRISLQVLQLNEQISQQFDNFENELENVWNLVHASLARPHPAACSLCYSLNRSFVYSSHC